MISARIVSALVLGFVVLGSLGCKRGDHPDKSFKFTPEPTKPAAVLPTMKGVHGKPVKSEDRPEEPVSGSPWNEYLDNEYAADQKFKGRIVRVTADVLQVRPGPVVVCDGYVIGLDKPDGVSALKADVSRVEVLGRVQEWNPPARSVVIVNARILRVEVPTYPKNGGTIPNGYKRVWTAGDKP